MNLRKEVELMPPTKMAIEQEDISYAPGLSPLDMFEKQLNMAGKSGEDAMILKQLREWDVDGNGSFSVAEVHSACKHFLHHKEVNKSLKRTLLIGAAISIVIMGVLLALMVAAVESTKDTRPQSSGELRTTAGAPVTVTQTSSSSSQIFNLGYFPDEALAEIKQLEIVNAQTQEKYMFNVAAFKRLDEDTVEAYAQIPGLKFEIDSFLGTISLNGTVITSPTLIANNRRRKGFFFLGRF